MDVSVSRLRAGSELSVVFSRRCVCPGSSSAVPRRDCGPQAAAGG